MRLRFLLLALALLAVAPAARAQNAITFDSLAKRIDPFFAAELVQDLKDALPQSPYDVWGYDVGDYSGDGANDIAIVIRQRNDTKRKMGVYFFIDDEGILRLVKQALVDFVELPIEVGVAIADGSAHMTHKLKEFNWEIYGYRYRDGVVMMVDKFTTERQGLMTYESYRNFQTLEGYERYLNTNEGDILFRSDFMTTPSYGRGRDVSSGYQTTTVAKMTRYIMQGSYYWQDEKDLTLDVRSAYDREYLYFNILVHDDHVVPAGLNGVDTTADRLELWFDMYSLGDRFRVGRRTRDFRMKTDSNIYAMNISLGDFIDQQSAVKLSSSNTLDEKQLNAIKAIKSVAMQADSGYTVKLRIPWPLFGFETAPLEDEDVMQFGLNVVVHDVDNPYRPEEVTSITTSQNFDRMKPATFGSLVLIPGSKYYGESTNIFLGELKERLKEVGY